jgi:multicomponent Na+:H+ antiporter subunit G
MNLAQIITLTLAAIGVFFMFVSAIGIVRLPDVYTRMHALGKTSTLGVSCILLGAGLYFGEWTLARMVILIALFFITAPISSTTMGRAAYRTDHERNFVLHYDDLAAHEARRRGEPNIDPDHRG